MSDAEQVARENYVELAAEIVSAYVSNNSMPVGELPALIASVHAALSGAAYGSHQAAGPGRVTPAQIKKSITPDYLVSFEDGKPYKTLRRHLTLRGLTADEYRAKWGLPVDYPMTSASYSAQRSLLAKELGLGQQRRKSSPKPKAKAAVLAEAVSEAPKSRRGGRKSADSSAAADTPAKARSRRSNADATA
ncbi:MucR family transcriptional regulator [Methylobacterium nigriterrae]|uniref:MucR family transcriptional regulator n=1 Tax=Methylobacterium nigriterrae TaxID=3127512 RepID=UPI003013D37D